MATKLSEDVRGIKSRKPYIEPVVQMPYRPQNKYLSRDDFLTWRKNFVSEMKAVDEKRRQLIADTPELAEPMKVLSVPKGLSKVQAKEKADLEARIEYLRSKLVEVKTEMEADPKAKGPKIQQGKINSELDRAETELDKLEALIDTN